MKLVLAAVAVAACGAEAPPTVGGDPPEAIFDPDHVVEVELELDPTDWETLRAQTRSWVQIYASCLSAPFASPFTYFPAAATVDGTRFERAAVRKKGFLGSLSVTKPSLKIELDGADDLVLNNADQDPSYVRTCLAYATFTAAGLPAPRCNFAHVRVNREDLGLYVHVEKVGKDFLARHFDDAGGNLYEGTYSDFRDGWTATFELDSGQEGDRGELDAVIAALAQPDAEMPAALDAVLDLERFLSFWAVEVLVTHRDGYAGNANNYFAYRDPSDGRFQLLPWGADGTFLPGPDPFGTGRVAVTAGAAISQRLYGLPSTRDRYLARLRELLDTVWDEDTLAAELDRMQALIAPIVDPDGTGDLAGAIDEVRAMIRGRRAAILDELAAGPPTWDRPLSEPPCLHPIGEVSGRLTTTWGTTGSDAFASGTGTFAATVDGAPLDALDVGATAGWAPTDPTRARLAVETVLADGTQALLVFLVDPELLHPGASLPVDWIAAKGTLYRYTATGERILLGLVAVGAIDVVAGATTDGEVVDAAFHATVVSPPG